MRSATTVSALQAALTRERRSNRRLRGLIDDLHTQLASHQSELDSAFERLVQLQASFDQLAGALGSLAMPARLGNPAASAGDTNQLRIDPGIHRTAGAMRSRAFDQRR